MGRWVKALTDAAAASKSAWLIAVGRVGAWQLKSERRQRFSAKSTPGNYPTHTIPRLLHAMRRAHHTVRCAAPRRTQSTVSAAPKDKIFNTRAKLMQRERGARSPESASCDYIREEVASRLADRLRDIQGYTYPTTVDYQCHAGQLTKKLLASKAGIEHIYACDSSMSALTRDDGLPPTPFSSSPILDHRSNPSHVQLAPTPSGR